MLAATRSISPGIGFSMASARSSATTDAPWVLFTIRAKRPLPQPTSATRLVEVPKMLQDHFDVQVLL